MEWTAALMSCRECAWGCLSNHWLAHISLCDPLSALDIHSYVLLTDLVDCLGLVACLEGKATLHIGQQCAVLIAAPTQH